MYMRAYVLYIYTSHSYSENSIKYFNMIHLINSYIPIDRY